MSVTLSIHEDSKMPIQTPLKHIKVGPWVAPQRTLLDIPEGVLTITHFTRGSKSGSKALLIRMREGSRSVAFNGVDWGNAADFSIPDTLPEGLSAPGNALPPKPAVLADIPDYRVFMANSVSNGYCRVLWFKIGSEVYYYDRLKHYTVNHQSFEDPVAIDIDLEKQRDHWTPADATPNRLFFVTDWVVQFA